MIFLVVSLICVGILWGATNPFLKRGSKDIKNIEANTKFKKFLLEIRFILTTSSNLIPLLLNQSGSLLYILTLQGANLSIAAPVANSLSFVFTAISGYFLGEVPSKNILLGSIFVTLGSTLLIYDKV